jgi:hypothetical protein
MWDGLKNEAKKQKTKKLFPECLKQALEEETLPQVLG